MYKKQSVIFIVGFVLFMFSITFAQQTEKPLTNTDVITMIKANLPESTIVLAIQKGSVNFDTSPTALIELKNQGATPKILDAVLQATSKDVSKPEKIATLTIKAQMPKVESKFFTFEVLQCTLFGKRLTCEILVTNADKDKKLQIFDADRNTPTRIVDNSGNEYKVATVQFGALRGTSIMGRKIYDERVTLVTGVPIKATIIFDNLPQDITKVSLLEIFCNADSEDYNGEDFSVQLRNVPITINTPISDGKTARVFEREFSFDFSSCQRNGTSVVCSVLAKNNGSEENKFILNVNCLNEASRMIDDTGTEYVSVQGSIGKEIVTKAFGQRCYATGKIAPGEVTTMTVTFDNVKPDARVIKLLRLTSGNDYGLGDIVGQFYINFRDIPLNSNK
jgi:hypothetical protein